MRIRNYGLSIRTIADLTGSSFGTIQGILSGRTRAPTELTLRRIQQGAGLLPTFVDTRPRTRAFERPLWNADDLANLVPPQGARFFRVIYEAEGTGTGFASTDWVDVRRESPLDVVIRTGADPAIVRRVIFERR